MASPEICSLSFGADVAFLEMNEAVGESSRDNLEGSLMEGGANIGQEGEPRQLRRLASLGSRSSASTRPSC